MPLGWPRGWLWLVEAGSDIDLATLVMSAAEFAELLRRERRLARDIRDEGIEL